MKRKIVPALGLALVCLALISAAAAEGGSLTAHCAERGFSVGIPAGATAGWDADDGVFYVWLGQEGYVPNVYIVRREKKLNNPGNYVHSVYTQYMEQTWGEDLRAKTLYETYEAGGKQLYASAYVYKAASGNMVNQLVLVEVRDDGDVEYIARYLNSQRDTALEALDGIVRSYQPDAEKKGGLSLNATPVKPVVSGTAEHADSRFTMTLPAGWSLATGSDYMTFCFRAWDPECPDRSIFLFMKLEPFLKSWAAKAKYQEVNNSLGGHSMYEISADAPVLETRTLKGFLDCLPQVREFCAKYAPLGMSISPDLLPQINGPEIVERMQSSLPAPQACPENIIGRISFTDGLGRPCEGLVTAQPIETMAYDFFGVDGWPCTVYLFMGVTTPAGEMREAEETLLACLGSFAFTESYVRKAIGLSNEETRQLLEQGRQMQAAHDAMVDAWYRREQAHDIAFQKWSDSFMGYDRLYDAATGEVYLAETGFYDRYDLHREEYANSSLQLVTGETESCYLQPADYYITQ